MKKQKDPESILYTKLENDISLFENSLALYFETEYTKLKKSISTLKSIEEEAEKKIIAINEINNKNSKIKLNQKSINSITLIEEDNLERISTNESNDKHLILVSNTGHVIKKRKIKRKIQNFTIDNSQELLLKNLYNNQIVLENTISTHTKEMDDILLEKEIHLRKKLLTKAILNNRKMQEIIKKEKIQKYFSKKNNDSDHQTGTLITMFGSCGPNVSSNRNDIINNCNNTNNNSNNQDDENCAVA